MLNKIKSFFNRLFFWRKKDFKTLSPNKEKSLPTGTYTHYISYSVEIEPSIFGYFGIFDENDEQMKIVEDSIKERKKRYKIRKVAK